MSHPISHSTLADRHVPRVAVVAIVRDECTDLLGWLGWYVRLGVATIVVFDDGSSDGTGRLIQDAACHHDIRLYRIEKTEGDHLGRQRAVYMHALSTLRETHDWVAFLDADEYVLPERHETLPSYLMAFDETVSAVAVNWCNYGSSGHVLKPPAPVFHAFVHHACPEAPINRHVKTFLRPARWTGEWVNVHYFPIGSGRYVDAAGRDVVWSGAPGIVADAPDWKGARVLHYQTRSMEHYVERVRRRQDTILDAAGFHQTDFADICTDTPRRYTGDVLAWCLRVRRQSFARALDALMREVPADGSSTTGSPETERAVAPSLPRLFSVHARDGNRLIMQDGQVRVEGRGPAQDRAAHIWALYAEGLAPGVVFLMLVDDRGDLAPFTLGDDGRQDLFLPFDIRSGRVPGAVRLRHPQMCRFLRAAPLENGGAVAMDGAVGSRPQEGGPEDEGRFVLNEEGFPAAADLVSGPLCQLLGQALAAPVTLAALIRFARQDFSGVLALLPILLIGLSDDERALFEARLGFRIS